MFVVAFGLTGVAFANGQEALEERVRKLEAAPGLRIKDGLKFSSEDGNFAASLNGRALFHYRSILDRPDGDPPVRSPADSFFVRQARLEASGTFYKEFDFKVQYSAGSGSTLALEDGWLGWNRLKGFSVRAGQYRQPFSQEESCSTRFLDFAERSYGNVLTPGREVGLMVHGKLFEEILGYELSAAGGNGKALDNNDEKALYARLQVMPFVTGDMIAVKNLRIGVAVGMSRLDEVAIGAATLTDGYDFTGRESAITYMNSTAGTIDGERLLLGVELSYSCGPLGIRAEWIRRTDEVVPEEVDTEAAYAQATWILTGESKVQENRITPAHPFITDGGSGAVELALRLSTIEISEEIFDAGVAPRAGNSAKARALTVGINWWPIKNVRITPNVILEKFGDDVALDSNELEDSATTFLVRFQVDF
jgi:phosphate-selective porin OprO/OprP